MDRYKVNLTARGMVSDGYVDARNFDQTVKMDTHANLNVSADLGDVEDQWELSVWARNILEPLPSRFPEFSIFPDDLGGTRVSSSQLMSYGMQFNYSF